MWRVYIFFEVFIFCPDIKVLGDIFVALLISTSDTSLINKDKTVQTHCAIHCNLEGENANSDYSADQQSAQCFQVSVHCLTHSDTKAGMHFSKQFQRWVYLVCTW